MYESTWYICEINDKPPLNIQNNVHNCQSMMHKTGIRNLMIGNRILNFSQDNTSWKFAKVSAKSVHETQNELTVDESWNYFGISNETLSCLICACLLSKSNKLEFSNSIFNHQNLNESLLAIDVYRIVILLLPVLLKIIFKMEFPIQFGYRFHAICTFLTTLDL